MLFGVFTSIGSRERVVEEVHPDAVIVIGWFWTNISVFGWTLNLWVVRWWHTIKTTQNPYRLHLSLRPLRRRLSNTRALVQRPGPTFSKTQSDIFLALAFDRVKRTHENFFSSEWGTFGCRARFVYNFFFFFVWLVRVQIDGIELFLENLSLFVIGVTDLFEQIYKDKRFLSLLLTERRFVHTSLHLSLQVSCLVF